MKRLLLITFILVALPSYATAYFLSPTGSDGNNGTSTSTPWLSPNHSVNCGDTLTAVEGSYSAVNFAQAKWGTVTCASANNVAWVQCATFDACKITSTTGIQIASSYWGIQGFEFNTTGSSSNSCIFIGGSGTGVIHHIIVANNVLNVCPGTGLQSANTGTTNSFDYVAYIGNIVYGAAGGNTSSCSSGMSMYQPIALDSLPGTHLFIAGNFSFVNVDPPTCAGVTSTDGEGLILDTLDGSQGGMAAPYSQQVAIENNMFLSNGFFGFEVLNNSAGAAHAAVYATHNTLWGNSILTNQNTTWCSEMIANAAFNVQVTMDLSVTSTANGCVGNALYAYFVAQSATTTNHFYNEYGYSATATNCGLSNSTGFVCGPNNVFGTNPGLVNPSIPSAPSCASTASVPSCMAAVISNFSPIVAAAKPYGYQIPSPTSVYDPLYPQWLCTVTLPAGLVTPGCVTGTFINAPMINGVTVR